MKDLFSLIYITVLTVLAGVYGFMIIPSPALQRERLLDHKRVTDLGQIQYTIDDYYHKANQLPQTLEALSTNSYAPSTPLTKIDPQTSKPYEYQITNQLSYKLCATFTTDSSKEAPSTYDDQNYNYTSFRDKFKHAIGTKCFIFSVVPTNQNQLPWPSYPPGKIHILPLPIGSKSAVEPLTSQ
ncbi:MAG TPA: hypothetical protein VE090_05865 [Methylomirabilota bacterium]|nr:hypothetical protein [Methylomirabilota bacterium]